MQTTWPLTHVIAATEVDAEEMKLGEVLASAGYAVAKLTLTSLAQQVVAERVKAKVVDLSIPLIAAMHAGQPDGWFWSALSSQPTMRSRSPSCGCLTPPRSPDGPFPPFPSSV